MNLIIRMILTALAEALRELPQNKTAWTYDIMGDDHTAYLTRTLLPRVLGKRPLIHRIRRADGDPDPHNHPWVGSFMIVSGGYTEERVTDVATKSYRYLRPGDVNHLDLQTFHRVLDVLPNTITVGLVGERRQEWGFLVDNEVIPWREYLHRRARLTSKADGYS